MKWRSALATKRAERAASGHAGTVKLVARTAKSIHDSPSPEGVDRAAQLRHRLGARIRALRDARGLTQEIVADRIAVTPKYVSQLECGQRSPSWETLVAIAHYGFEVRLAALVFGIDEDIPAEVQDLNDMLAGRPKETRRDLLQAMQLMLRARGEPK
jgi:transcriptional regulator with XRE-family HTH domain